MAKKATLKIDYAGELDFSLTGISCGYKDFRLCFDLNRAFDISMERTDDVILPLTRPGASTVHSCFQCAGPDGEMYYLVSNRDRNGSGFFVPEHKNLSYFFVISGEGGRFLYNSAVEIIRQVPIVEAAYEVNPAGLKSGDAFFFLLEF